MKEHEIETIKAGIEKLTRGMKEGSVVEFNSHLYPALKDYDRRIEISLPDGSKVTVTVTEKVTS